MLWLAWIGIAALVIGAGIVAIGMMQYIVYLRDMERMANEITKKCESMTGWEADGCYKGKAIGESFVRHSSLQLGIIGAVVGSIGVAIFAIGYQRSRITRVTNRG